MQVFDFGLNSGCVWVESQTASLQPGAGMMWGRSRCSSSNPTIPHSVDRQLLEHGPDGQGVGESTSSRGGDGSSQAEEETLLEVASLAALDALLVLSMDFFSGKQGTGPPGVKRA